MKNISTSKIISLALLAAVVVTPLFGATAAAQPTGTSGGTSVASTTKPCTSAGIQLTLLPPWYKGLECENGTVKMFKGNNGLQRFILQIIMNGIEILFYIVGYVSLAMIIWGGFKYMMFGDSSSGMEGAKKTIQNAIIGLVISIFAVVIVNLVTGVFNAAP